MSPDDARLLRYLGLGLLFIFGLWFVYAVRDILTLFLLAAIVAYVLDPLLDRLEVHGWSRGRAAAIVFLVGALMCAALFVALIPPVTRQVQSLSDNFSGYGEQLTQTVDRLRKRLSHQFPQFEPAIAQGEARIREFAPQVAASVALWVKDQLPKIFTYLVILPLLSFYLMMDFHDLSARVIAAIPVDYRTSALGIGHRINHMLGRYVRGQLLVCAIYGLVATMYFVAMSLVFGTKYALLLGLLTAFLAVIPFVGILTIAILAALIGYLTCDPGQSATVAALVLPCGLFVISPTIDNLVTPRVIGKETGLHPVTIIFSLMSASQIAGIFGMVVAIPVAAAVKIVLITIFPSLTGSPSSSPPALAGASSSNS